MGEQTDKYPYGPYPVPIETPWYEPIAMLSAFAAATEQIRLTTGIMISPLRSAGLLAKQLSTLHFLSRGRVDIGFGVGWQEAEYEICRRALFEGALRAHDGTGARLPRSVVTVRRPVSTASTSISTGNIPIRCWRIPAPSNSGSA